MGKLFDIWKQWCDLTTFHGFNELRYFEKFCLRSVIWAFLIFGATFAAVFEVTRVFQDWQNNPTAVQIREITSSSVELPDLILCSGSRLDINRLRHAGASESLINGLIFSTDNPMHIISKYKDRMKYAPIWWEEYKNFSTRLGFGNDPSFFRNFSVPCREFLVYCNTYYGGNGLDCCANATLVLDYVYFGCYRLSNFGSQTWPGNAAGITLGLRSYIWHQNETTAGILNGAAVQILHPSFPYNFEKINIPGNSMVSISLHPQRITHINSVRQKCRPLSPNPTFMDSNTGCIWKFWMDIWKKTCQCNTFIYAPDPNYPYCNIFDFLLRFKLNESSFKAIADYTIAHQKECETPQCESWDYNPLISTQPIQPRVLDQFLETDLRGQNDSFIVAEIFYPKLSYTWVQEINVYSVDSFISNVGGQLGLWMGVSALTLMQAFSYVFDCLKTLANQRRKNELKKTSVETARKHKIFDSLTLQD